MSFLKDKVHEKLADARDRLRMVVREHGHKVIHELTLAQAYGGLRGVPCILWEPSLLDPAEGIRFRGYTIPELQEALPKAVPGGEPLPEGLFYLLLTGELPSDDDVAEVRSILSARSEVPEYVHSVIHALPRDTHPMTMFSLSVLAMQRESVFAARYRDGMDRAEHWDATYEDAMNLLGKVPNLAALVYRHSCPEAPPAAPVEEGLDWAGALACRLGNPSEEFRECMRLYMFLHADHEGGNVTAHASRVVGSALSDAYYVLSAGLNGLAGPLHGLANQEVLRWILHLMDTFGGAPTAEQIRGYLWETLNRGHVIPGYGHAVLRKTDPRYSAQREFALRHMPDDPIFRVVSLLFEITPDVLLEHGKAKNPWPNVDAHSGCLLYHYGVRHYDFYTVLFGCSRAFGVLASLIWDRGLGLPLERPKSFTTDYALEHLVSGR